jgi:hypothetical protein
LFVGVSSRAAHRDVRHTTAGSRSFAAANEADPLANTTRTVGSATSLRGAKRDTLPENLTSTLR